MSDKLIKTIASTQEEFNTINDNVESSFDIISGPGVDITNENGIYTVSSNSSGILTDNLGELSAGDTIQNALESLLEKVSESAGISSGRIIRTTAEGIDVDFPEVEDLLENTMYLRLVLNNGKALHISAFEIDRALDTVARLNMDKADQSDVEALAAALDSKASNVRLELFENDIANKADKTTVNLLSATVENKAEKSDLETVSAAIENKAEKSDLETVSAAIENKAEKSDLETVSAAVENKANIDTVIKLQNDVQALHNTLNSLSDSAAITAIKNQINYLNTEIQRRLTIDDLRSLETATANLSNEVEASNERITALEKNIVNKASVTYVQRNVNELNSVITNVAAKVDNKADKSSVANKASQEDFNLLVKRITDLSSTTTGNVESLNNSYLELQEELSKKASKTSLDKLSNDLSKSLDKQLNSAAIAFNKKTEKLNEKIDAIDIETPINTVKTNLHNIQKSIENRLSTTESYINVFNKKFPQYDQQLNKMQETDEQLRKVSSNEWVRVMTPEEYARLQPNPNYPDGTKNPFGKQPNVLYMLIRYNKPIALYIGTVLIAEAKQDGSIGFAYEFPIIF